MVAKGPVAHKDGDITIDQDGKLDAGGREIMYTRDGSLSLDSEGYLVTSSGERVLGYVMTDGMDDDGTINYVDADSPDIEAKRWIKNIENT